MLRSNALVRARLDELDPLPVRVFDERDGLARIAFRCDRQGEERSRRPERARRLPRTGLARQARCARSRPLAPRQLALMTMLNTGRPEPGESKGPPRSRKLNRTQCGQHSFTKQRRGKNVIRSKERDRSFELVDLRHVGAKLRQMESGIAASRADAS